MPFDPSLAFRSQYSFAALAIKPPTFLPRGRAFAVTGFPARFWLFRSIRAFEVPDWRPCADLLASQAELIACLNREPISYRHNAKGPQRGSPGAFTTTSLRVSATTGHLQQCVLGSS